MADRDYNVGYFMEEARFLEPVVIDTPSGSDDNDFVEAAVRLCEVRDDIRKPSVEGEAMAEDWGLSLFAWEIPGVSTEWRVDYNGNRYVIDRILREDRGIQRIDIKRIDICD